MDKVISYIEESFLKDLLFNKAITDISYNGKSLFYYSQEKGRRYYKTIDNKIVATFLRNIANFANERFSYMDTFLDISCGKYRLSAMHNAISRYGFFEGLSFSLRINHNFISENPNYLGDELRELLKRIMQEKRSIIISGSTGVGKTTLQKYLITLLPKTTRLMVIDNVLELGEVSLLDTNLDITLWQAQSIHEAEIKDLIQKALRFQPDYLIIAESRGSEMKEIIQGAISGHPNIVTIHADQAELTYSRVSYLAGIEQSPALYRAFPYVIHLSKIEGEKGIKRYIEKIIKFDIYQNTFVELYKKEKKICS